MQQLETRHKELGDRFSISKYPRIQRPLYRESPFEEAKSIKKTGGLTSLKEKSKRQAYSKSRKKSQEKNLILDKVRRCQEVLQGAHSARAPTLKTEEIRCDDRITTKSISPRPDYQPFSLKSSKKSPREQPKGPSTYKKMAHSKSIKNFPRWPHHMLPQIQIKKVDQAPDLGLSDIDKSTCSLRPLLNLPSLDRSGSKSSNHSSNSSDSKDRSPVSFYKPSYFSKSNQQIQLTKKRSMSPLIPLSRDVPLECSKEREMKEVKSDYYGTCKPVSKKAPFIPQNTVDKFPQIKPKNKLTRGYSLENQIKDIKQINMVIDKPLYPPKVKPSKVFNELRSAWI